MHNHIFVTYLEKIKTWQTIYYQGNQTLSKLSGGWAAFLLALQISCLFWMMSVPFGSFQNVLAFFISTSFGILNAMSLFKPAPSFYQRVKDKTLISWRMLAWAHVNKMEFLEEGRKLFKLEEELMNAENIKALVLNIESFAEHFSDVTYYQVMSLLTELKICYVQKQAEVRMTGIVKIIHQIAQIIIEHHYIENTFNTIVGIEQEAHTG